MEIKELEKKREAQINGLFILMLEIAVIFAIPSFTALFLGKYLDRNLGIGFLGQQTYTFIGLFIAFTLSWIMVAILYKKKTRELKRTEDLIKEAKKNNV